VADEKLSTRLVKNNAHVWVDHWELNVGDSILNRVQTAIQESDALLIILSKASVASQWCNKELNAGLIRELEEKRVLVLPVLIEDCEIPLFLREKLYADFRGRFDVCFKALIEAVAKVTSLDQARMKSGKATVDWSEIWGEEGDLIRMEYAFVETSPEFPFTLLIEATVRCNDESTRRYKAYDAAGLDWVARSTIIEGIAEFVEKNQIDVLLTDQSPVIRNIRFFDNNSDARFDLSIRCRRMGEDNGKDQLVHVSN
jgi:hypothetical protein